MRYLCIGFVLYVVFTYSTESFAQVRESSNCVRKGVTRVVELSIENPSGVPCDVTYRKPDEGNTSERLWFANSDPDFCVARYQDFLTKLTNKLAWSCTPNQHVSDARIPVDKKGMQNTLEDQPDRTSKSSKLKKTAEKINPPEDQIKLAEFPILIEPALRSASPARSPTLFKPGIDFPPDPMVMPLQTLKEFFRSGYYATESSNPHTGDTSICPEDGYFVWNTRNPSKPVYELGRELEFAIDIGNMSSIDELEHNVDEATVNKNCDISIEYSACQYPNRLDGLYDSQKNDLSFTCDAKPASGNVATYPLALFQNRHIKPNDSSACSGTESIIHMALAPLKQNVEAALESPTGGIEIIIIKSIHGTGNRATVKRAHCKFISR